MHQIIPHLKNNIQHNPVTHPWGTLWRIRSLSIESGFLAGSLFLISPNPTKISLPNHLGDVPMPWPSSCLSPPHLVGVIKALTHLTPKPREPYFKRVPM